MAVNTTFITIRKQERPNQSPGTRKSTNFWRGGYYGISRRNDATSPSFLDPSRRNAKIAEKEGQTKHLNAFAISLSPLCSFAANPRPFPPPNFRCNPRNGRQIAFPAIRRFFLSTLSRLPCPSILPSSPAAAPLVPSAVSSSVLSASSSSKSAVSGKKAKARSTSPRPLRTSKLRPPPRSWRSQSGSSFSRTGRQHVARSAFVFSLTIPGPAET